MRVDAQLSFVPIGGNLSLVGAAGVGIPSTNTIDLLDQGVGTAPQNIIGDTPATGFNSGNFGTDVGIGRYRAEVEVVLNSAITLTTGTAATLNIEFQGAEDTGAAGNYQPGAWQTFVETGPITLAQLNASIATATQIPIARFTFPPAFPANFAPRYLRLLFQPAAGTDFTAGQVACAIVTTVRDDQANKFAAKNFVVQ